MFLKKNKPHSELFLLHHAIPSFAELHSIPIMAFKFQSKEMYPSFVFAKCCWSIHSKGLARTRTANREKPLPYKLRSFKSSSYTYPASSTSIWCIFSIYGLVWSNIGNSLDAEKQKNWFKYTDFTELKKITGRINSNTSNFSSLFFKSIKLVAVRFVWLKNNLQLTVQVCCLFYFLIFAS